jgi:hypothetical protein
MTAKQKQLMRDVLAALGPDAHDASDGGEAFVGRTIRYKSGVKKGQAHGYELSRLEYKAAQLGSAAAQLGSRGGKARARNLTKKQISAIGQMGARARWAKPRTSRPPRGCMILMVPKASVRKFPGEKWYVRTSRKNPTLAVTPFKDNDAQMVATQLEATAFRTAEVARSVIKRILADMPSSKGYADFRVIEVA